MIRLLLASCVVALAATACGSTAPPAATVGDSEISQSELDDDVAAVAALQEEAVEQGQATPEDTISLPASREDVASVLSRRIWVVSFEDAIAEAGGTVPAVDDELTPEHISELIQVLAATELDVDPEAPIDTVLDRFPVDVQPVCASHILVASADEATAVVGRLDGGEDFAAVATEVSTDQGSAVNGGALGCAPPRSYVAEFRDALIALEDGSRSAPVQTEFGFHIINREGVDTADVTTRDLLGFAASDIAIGVLREADVDVLERLGSWDAEAEPPQVVVRL